MSLDLEHMSNMGRELSYYLRHHPEEANLDMDEHGWVATEQVVSGMMTNNPGFTFEILANIVANDSKGRFEFCDDDRFIRACQGHSVKVDLGLQPIYPPNVLYHGTAKRFVDSINKDGLLPMSRNHVHLSADYDTAIEVGLRHGTPVVYEVNALQMYEDGYSFYLSDNNVWLTDFVPTQYLVLL